MRPVLALVGLAFVTGCYEGASTRSIAFPHDTVRVDGVCAGAPVARDLAITVEAPHANQGMRRFRVVNHGRSSHEVRASFVVADSGACGGPFVRSRRLGLEDAATCQPPEARTLAPEESVELRIPPHRAVTEDACTKFGLALHVEVDGEAQCLELGAWIAARSPD